MKPTTLASAAVEIFYLFFLNQGGVLMPKKLDKKRKKKRREKKNGEKERGSGNEK